MGLNPFLTSYYQGDYVGKKFQGSHTGIYTYDHLEWDEGDRLAGLVYYTSKKGEGFGTYEMTLEKFVELKRPEKIKVVDTIEVIK